MAELADAQDLKSCEAYPSYRFDPGHQHQTKPGANSCWEQQIVSYRKQEEVLLGLLPVFK